MCNHVGNKVCSFSCFTFEPFDVDQISILRTRGAEAAVLRVKKGNDTDSLIISQWEGACESITQVGYKIVFVTRRLFYLVMMDWKFYKAVFICQPSKQSW